MTRTFRLGLFIVSTLTILAIGVFLIGDQQFLFSSTYELKASFKNVVGLNQGAEVRIGGIHKGTVKEIRLPEQPGGEMTVSMDLESSTQRVVRKDSVASIQTEGLLGNKYVEISFGSPDALTVEDGFSIQGAPPLDVSDLMKKTNEILDTTKLTMVNVQESSSHFNDISAKINQGQGTMGALINEKRFYEQLNEASNQAKLGASAFQENMQALKTNFFIRGFFNRRGYDDAAKLAQNEIAELPQGPYLKKFAYDTKKIFRTEDGAKLKNQKSLNEAGQFLEGNPFSMAIVVASGGMKGDAEEVRTLTQARAMVVRDYLVNEFRMDDTRFKTMGLGKNEKAATDAGSVEILIYPSGSGVRPPALSAK